MSSPIFVSGATGNTGGEVVKQLIEKGIPVRAGIHLEQKGTPLKDLGAEVVSVDFKDTKSIVAALDGVVKAYSVSPLVPSMVKLGVNFVKAAKQAGVKYMVRASGLGADSPQAITLGRWHREVEKTVEDSGIAYTLVRPNSFMQNYITYASHTVKTQNAFYLPQGEGKISLIDVRDIAAVIVAVLTEGGHEGKAYDLTGLEAISNYQVAEILSKITGRTINYVDVTEDTARQNMKGMGMPEAIVEGLLELSAIIKAGYVSTISPAVEQVIGRKPISFERFANDFAEAFK